ncbi:MAG: cytochrome-c oxidase, cbb3-type subunit II [Myxococcota bacterium]
MSEQTPGTKPYWHRRLLEPRAGLMAIVTTLCISVGGLVEIVPMFTVEANPAEVTAKIAPYTPLEVAGRDIYIREGCYVCHSQMVRPFRDETLRYGAWSRSEEYTWDRPFLLGSRRTGPDLARVGGKYPDAWHYEHMRDPRSMTSGSIMPAYAWLIDWKIDPEDVRASVVALKRVGTPYTDEQVARVPELLKEQGDKIVANYAAGKVTAEWDDEIVALTAYLQRLGHMDATGPVAAVDGGAP